MHETLWETESERLILERDDCAEMPDGDGMCPVLEIGTRGMVRIAVDSTGYDLSRHVSYLAEAMRQFIYSDGTAGGGMETFARYVRIFHNGEVITDFRNWYHYVCVVTDTMREAWGCSYDATPDMTEFLAYLDGEVYGAVLQEREHVTGIETVSTFDGDVKFTKTWEEDIWTATESFWGLYGYDYARGAALENFPEPTDNN